MHRRRGLHVGPDSTTTGTMGGTNPKLTTAVETYLDDLRRIRASGGATGERSSYGPLANLLNAVGATLKPRVFCVGELADQGAGHPDFGLYTAKQVQRGRPREGQAPERGVVEVKSAHEDLRAPAVREQVVRYWGRYRLVLVTNLREFGLVGPDPDGGEAMLESFRLAESEEAFDRRLEHPRAFARAVGAGLGEYLSRALSHRAALAEPKDLAWLLASYARDGLARVEAAGDAPSLKAVRSALEDALGVRFEGERGARFFRSTLVQTLFYGVFSAWVLWARAGAAGGTPHPAGGAGYDTARFSWREAVWHLRAPVLRALFQQLSDPGRLQPLGLVEVLDWTAAALDRVDREAFFSRFNEGEAVPYFYEPFLEAFDPDAAQAARCLVHAGRSGPLHGRPRGPGAEGRPRHPGRARRRERLRARPVLRHRGLSGGSAAPHRRQPRRSAASERSPVHGSGRRRRSACSASSSCPRRSSSPTCKWA